MAFFSCIVKKVGGMSTKLTLEFIRQSVPLGQYEISLHADEERLEDGLTIQELCRSGRMNGIETVNG
jgi:hypothetical protein